MSACDKLSLQILIDNHGQDELQTEHGFSIWIEYGEHVILFDTGCSDSFINNAVKLGCDLSEVDTLVLSHGHYDHTGGISALFALNPHISVIAHPAVMTSPRYSLHPDKAPHMIAMPEPQLDTLQSLPLSQRVLTHKPFEIGCGCYFSGEIPRMSAFEDVGGPFYLDTEKVHPDTLSDDASIWFETDAGLIIVTGCCHSGLMNTVQYIQNVSGEKRVAAIIGGLHLVHADKERLHLTAQALNEWKPDFVVTCHCSGSDAVQVLKQQTSVNIIDGYAGFDLQLSLSASIQVV